ncbi:MAG TPA: GNAT family N-acetyltransferase [Anaerolineae bacterium]|nr:GNAT family N-acetyltransferase [Anaerolineae bacterium]
MTTDIKPRAANKSDYSQLAVFLNSRIKIHRHLDWRATLDWLGYQPFWILEQNSHIQALLAFPPDIPDVYWVRLFAVSCAYSAEKTWDKLFPKALKSQPFKPESTIVILAYLDWLKEILLTRGWQERQRVILLKWSGSFPETLKNPKGIIIRPMLYSDLQQVARIDHVSFESIWRHSTNAIMRAFGQSSYSTVAEHEEKVIAYQISHSEILRAHLARLAIVPDFRNKGIGTALVQDMLSHFHKLWIGEITVNTQLNNYASIRLYKKLGFTITKESYPILAYLH